VGVTVFNYVKQKWKKWECNQFRLPDARIETSRLWRFIPGS